MNQPGNRPQAWASAQHGHQVAQAPVHQGLGGAGRPPAAGPTTPVSGRRGRRRQGDRLRAAGHPRGLAGPLEPSGAARRAHRYRSGRGRQRDHGVALAGRGRHQAVGYRSRSFPRDPAFAAKAAVVVDLYQRIFDGCRWAPATRSSAPMRKANSRPAAAAIRACRQNTSAGAARRARIRPRRHAGLPGGCPPCQAVWPLRAVDRHQAVRAAGRPGDDCRGVRLGASGVLGGGQRLIALRPGRRSSGWRANGPTCGRSTCRSTPRG